jgi:hypothetical protein
VLASTSPARADLRIYGLTAAGDTLECPYLLRLTGETTTAREIDFNRLNASRNERGHFFTFEIPAEEPINLIDLQFTQENFDWRIALEGSHDHNGWFTVLENYRILSIKNDLTDFRFTKLSFPLSTYRYYRLLIAGAENPELSRAFLTRQETTAGYSRVYPVKEIRITENKQSRQTEADLLFDPPVLLSRIAVGISDTFDFYRPATIKYLADSFRTELGWKHNYRPLASGVLNSLGHNEFKFGSRLVHRLKITIDNHDNRPLTIDTITAEGYVYEMTARFAGAERYFLVYGNARAVRPEYDIDRFAMNIPAMSATLELGEESVIGKTVGPATSPLFNDKGWLWATMSLILLLLGWFTLRMLKKAGRE